MQFLLIVVVAIGAACTYGIAHDLVTAHLCIEYFTIGHPTLIPGASPMTLALLWGVIATWWVGLLLGVPLACCARLGSAPPCSALQMLRPIALLIIVMAICSVVAGVIGHVLARSGAVILLEPLASRVPADRHVWFLTDLWAHLAAYATGAIGGIVLCVVTHRGRRRMAALQSRESQESAAPASR